MKKIIYIVAILGLLLVINGLARSIYDLLQKQELLTSAQKELEDEKLKNQKLKASLSYVETKEFKEEVARNNLFLTKPGEQQVVFPLKDEKKEAKKDTRPNWERWLDLFW
jgi:cell division protein FtsB